MSDRPVVVPGFGEYLRKAREKRGLSAGQVELQMERFGIPVAHAVLWRYEAGQVGSPDPAVLWALSRLYRISVDEMLGCLAKERAHRPIAQSDLVAPGITDRSAGLGDDAMEIARLYDTLSEDLRPVVRVSLTMLNSMQEKQKAPSGRLSTKRRR